MIIGKEINKTYGKNKDKRNVLSNINISIEPKEFLAIMGPSGCGKSTLLFSLSGTDNISSGSIRINNKEISNMKENELSDLRREKMGFVFQQPTMLKNLNILDNIILPSLQNNSKNISVIKERAKKLMQDTGIDNLAKRDITEVSGGQLQRAGICRALINSPDILFADEPTGALNSKAADEIMGLFSKINNEGTAVMLVTHDVKVASRAKRVLFMKDGELVYEILMSKYSDKTIKEKIELILREMKKFEV